VLALILWTYTSDSIRYFREYQRIRWHESIENVSDHWFDNDLRDARTCNLDRIDTREHQSSNWFDSIERIRLDTNTFVHRQVNLLPFDDD
jgi:hypothetical protein